MRTVAEEYNAVDVQGGAERAEAGTTRRGEEEWMVRRRDGRMDVILARGSSSIDR